MAKARRRRIWSGSRDCLARVRRAAASKSGRRGTGAAMALLEQNWPPRNHTHAPKATPAHESHFGGVGITQPEPMGGAHIEPTGPHAAILGGLTIGPRRSNSEIVGGIRAPGKDRPASLALDPKDDG